MTGYTVDPNIELCLYFCMLAISSVFLPVGVNILFAAPLKVSLLIGTIFLVTGSVSFVACSDVWTFIAMQSIFTVGGVCML